MNTPSTDYSITESLGIRGWRQIDPILLASLATEAPLLLIGPHGTAKSMLVERVARSLGLSMRHYNASLLNYDDLVGIPMPDDDGQSLRFITTPGAIWDAEFVFFDEISRCRPDLQNKMFPVVHERRIAGIKLDKLRYRWAAMNPPAPEDADGGTGEYYLGSEALDPALVDRFPYIVPVPNWRQLSKEDRRRLVLLDLDTLTPDETLASLIEQCSELLPSLEDALKGWLSDYIVSAVDLLEQSKLPASPRRAHMLARSLVAIHAARMLIEGEDADLETSAFMTLVYGLPHNATEVPPSRAKIMAIHRQAWEISGLAEDNSWRRVLEESDPVRRIALADQFEMSDTDLSRLVTQALGAEQSEARRVGLAVALFIAFAPRRNLTPAAWEPLAQLAVKVMEPRHLSVQARAGQPVDVWNEISEWLTELSAEAQAPAGLSLQQRAEENFVLFGYPELWTRFDWRAALEQFRQDWGLFVRKEKGKSA